MTSMSGGDYGRIRHTFWTDPDIKRVLSPEHKTLLLYYFSSPHRTLIGLYYCPLEYAASETGIALDRVREWTTGALSRFVTYDPATEEILVHRAGKHQVGENLKEGDNQRKAVIKALEEAHSAKLVRKFHELYAHWPLPAAPPEPSDGVDNTPSEPLQRPSEAKAVSEQIQSITDTLSKESAADAAPVDEEECYDVEIIEPTDDEPRPSYVLALRPADPVLPFDGMDADEPVNGGQIMAAWIRTKRPSLSRHDRGRMAAAAQRIADGRTMGQVRLAMLGMDFIWPYASPSVVKGSEGRAWDLMDLAKDFNKALVGSGKHPVIKQAREDAEWDAAFEEREAS